MSSQVATATSQKRAVSINSMTSLHIPSGVIKAGQLLVINFDNKEVFRRKFRKDKECSTIVAVTKMVRGEERFDDVHFY